MFCHFVCLCQLLKKQTYLPQRDPGGDLLMAVDHCFSIRGQGTVMTGTVLQGSLAINDTVEIPALKVCSKKWAWILNLWYLRARNIPERWKFFHRNRRVSEVQELTGSGQTEGGMAEWVQRMCQFNVREGWGDWGVDWQHRTWVI